MSCIISKYELYKQIIQSSVTIEDKESVERERVKMTKITSITARTRRV